MENSGAVLLLFEKAPATETVLLCVPLCRSNVLLSLVFNPRQVYCTCTACDCNLPIHHYGTTVMLRKILSMSPIRDTFGHAVCNDDHVIDHDRDDNVSVVTGPGCTFDPQWC